MRIHKLLKSGLALAAALAWAVPAGAQTSLYATGDQVWARFVGSDAGFTSELHFYAVYGGGSTQFLFNNHATTPGTEVLLAHSFTPGEEVIFGLYVQDTGYWYYTGPATRNPDGLNHVALSPIVGDPRYTVRTGWEDVYGGGDLDYNDLIFDFGGVTSTPTVAPEPVSMLLLGTGLAGIGGVGLRRRRRESTPDAAS